jgi:hypothetical protein
MGVWKLSVVFRLYVSCALAALAIWEFSIAVREQQWPRAELAGTLSEEEKRIVIFVAEHQKIKVTDAGLMLGVSWGTARRRLEQLNHRKILEHVLRKDIKLDAKAHYKLPTTRYSQQASQPELQRNLEPLPKIRRY